MVLCIGEDAHVRIGDILAIVGQPGVKTSEVIVRDREAIRRYVSPLSLRTLARRVRSPYGEGVVWKKYAR